MTTLVIGLILIVGGLAFAAAPLLRRRGSDADRFPGAATGSPGARSPLAPIPDPTTEPGGTADAAPSSVAAELEELALDHAMGKLGEDDYKRLRAAVEARARSTEVPARPATTPADPAPGERPDLHAEAERLVRAERERAVTCPACGPRPEPGARFCSGCGRAVGTCRACGAGIRQAGARFCDRCGVPLRG